MALKPRLLVTFVFVVLLSPAFCRWQTWSNREWSDTPPSNCPNNNTETHICTTLQATDGLCITIGCNCLESGNVTYIYSIYSSPCRQCLIVRSCQLYRCYPRCCDGYDKDHYGRCQIETGGIACENGGSPIRHHRKERCLCPDGFSGIACEIPICNCENGGHCTVQDGRPYCRCATGYNGSRCENAVCTTTCDNGGTCFKDNEREFCTCPRPYVGIQCELRMDQSDKCPVNYANDSMTMCDMMCTSNTDCSNGMVCCFEGCSTVCRQPKPLFCSHLGMNFSIGEIYRPNSCQQCTCVDSGKMECYNTTCAPQQCMQQQTLPDQCCPICTGTTINYINRYNSPPSLSGCPVDTTAIYTETDSDISYLHRNIQMYGEDGNGNKLQVKYNPSFIRHCHCFAKDAHEVEATVVDAYGQQISCRFYVIVKDRVQPMFQSCPEDYYVFAHETVYPWKAPEYTDNVEVANEMFPIVANKPQQYPVGTHTFTYMIMDWDGNVASCTFNIFVTTDDTPMGQLPQGLRNRSRDETSKMGIIIGSIVGCLIVTISFILMVCCCRRNRLSKSKGSETASLPPTYDSLYVVQYDLGSKSPLYDAVPPSYAECGQQNESSAPPCYTNPNYESGEISERPAA